MVNRLNDEPREWTRLDNRALVNIEPKKTFTLRETRGRGEGTSGYEELLEGKQNQGLFLYCVVIK